MKRLFLISLVVSLFFTTTINYAQDKYDEIILTIDNVDITLSEFERIYKKNNTDSIIDKESLKEYLDLFIKFKLKVLEAERLGLDTLKAFEVELQGYRRQLEKPFLTNDSIDENLKMEAYERMRKDVKASHILLRLDETATPKDTLEVYNRITKIRKRIINGEDFGKVARETSEDKSVKSNSGSLGYFTCFQMVYPFETAAYTTKIGDVSMPVRTKFGYHLIKVEDVRDAVGKVKVAHIMKSVPGSSKPEIVQQAKDTIFYVYEQLKNGADFSKLAEKYSDDKSTAARGGELRMFGTGKMIPEFEKIAFALTEIGEISEPVKTTYGYHIIKLLKKSEIKSYNEMKSLLKTKVSRDSRAEKSKNAVIDQLKNEYNFKYDKKKLAQFYKVVTETAYEGKWHAESAKGLESNFVWFADQSINQKWFANYMDERRSMTKTNSIEAYVNLMFNAFIESRIIKYEKSQLENKYPDFKYLMQEYHDGILLFELTDKIVWSKAVEDTSGLLEFYKKNKNNYLWGERFDGRIYTCKNEKTYKKLNKFLSKGENEKLTEDELLAKYNKVDTLLSIESGIYSKGDNSIIDKVIWNIGNNNIDNKVIVKGSKIDPEPKKLKEAKGLITADYQTFLEEKWVKSLKEKANIVINSELLDYVK